jgi:hypothetical protein
MTPRYNRGAWGTSESPQLDSERGFIPRER